VLERLRELVKEGQKKVDAAEVQREVTLPQAGVNRGAVSPASAQNKSKKPTDENKSSPKPAKASPKASSPKPTASSKGGGKRKRGETDEAQGEEEDASSSGTSSKDPLNLLDKKVQIRWPKPYRGWHEGTVSSYTPTKGYRVLYPAGDGQGPGTWEVIITIYGHMCYN